MSDIRAIYHNGAPAFPATDQHPLAARYVVGRYVVDAVGGEPTQSEIDLALTPTPIVQTDGLPQEIKDLITNMARKIQSLEDVISALAKEASAA